jgi:hypothetical protein
MNRQALRNRRLAIAGIVARRERADAPLERRESRSEWAANREIADTHERAGSRPASLEWPDCQESRK